VLLCACASDDRETSRLILARAPCLGTCPSYRLTVQRDGRVDYEGLGYFTTLGRRESERPTFRRDSTRISQKDVANLFAAFERGRSRWWLNQYVPRSRLACPMWSTDAPTITIVRERRSRSDTLSVYHGCVFGPTRIDRLGAHIDSIVGVTQWLGPKPPR